MVNLYKFSFRSVALALTFSGFVLISGCDRSASFDDLEKQTEVFKAEQHTTMEGQGRKLTDIAGRATLPPPEKNSLKKLKLSAQAQQLVGRYRVVIHCDDPFAQCDQGNAEFVLNLLPNGSAHRTFIHMGKVTYSSDNRYHKDIWVYDRHLNQVILIRGSGVQFYYDINAEHNLVMNLEKIANFTPENRQFFIDGNPFPQHAYVLKKIN